MVLRFVKNYNIEEVQATNWRVCVDKVNNCVIYYLKSIQLLKSKKICVGKFKKEIILGFTINRMHFCTWEDQKNRTIKVYTHKFNGLGFAYKIRIAIYKDHVLWIKGPVLTSKHDATIFQSDGGFHPDIPAEKKGIADSTYKAFNEMTVHIEGHSKEMTNFINCIHALHKFFNARLKCFKILFETFCGSWGKKEEHKIIFEAICILVQYDMENGHSLMET